MNRGSRAATRAPVVVFSIVLSLAVALAGPPPLPEPDAERGGIAVAAAQLPFSRDASLVYFAPIREDADMFAAESLVRSNHRKRGQVYRLNVRPGRYIAVAAIISGDLYFFRKR